MTDKTKNKRILNGFTIELDPMVGSPDGVNEPKTKPWAMPPEMLKPNGPSPLDYKVVPENKQNS